MKEAISQKFARGLLAVRPLVLLVFVAATVFFAWQAIQIQVNTDVSKMVPQQHPYIQNFLEHRDELNLGNDIRVIVEDVEHDDIFNQEYMAALKDISDEVRTFEGVDPSTLQSLWTPNVRWNAVTQRGFEGGKVIPGAYDGSPESLEQLRTNLLRSSHVGRLVADDFRSSIVHTELVDVLGSEAGVNIKELGASLEQLRNGYEEQYPFLNIHIVGQAKQIHDVIRAAEEVAMFFFITLVLTAFLLLIDTRSVRSTLAVTVCSVVAVIWQLGAVRMMGFTIDPYSMLVPFLVFAIAVSHGVQVVNAFANASALGSSHNEAAQYTVRSLFVPGLVALVSDAIGFATLYMINVGVIRELAMAASVGVAIIIFTNLVIVPVLLSYTGVGQRSLRKIHIKNDHQHPMARFFAHFTRKPVAAVCILVAAAGYGAGFYYSQDLRIGDLDKGAPSLWPDPCEEKDCPRDYKPKDKFQYNHDVNFLVSNYSVSADVLVVMGETPQEGCNSYEALTTMDDLRWRLMELPGVQDVASIASATKRINAAMNEGNPKWRTLSRDQLALNNAMRHMPDKLYNLDCSLVPIYVFLDDHRADTLNTVTAAVEDFAAEHNDPDVVAFQLASGNAGVEAATNQTIAKNQHRMLALIYSVVGLLVLVAFRSLRAVVCILVPLGLTSVLCQALMAQLGIGVKVATLPVIALGVGIGVDYGIYIYSKLDRFLKEGMDLQDAYRETLKTTGKAVAFTGLTLAVGVVLWVFSSIKFQADMGLLLTFMFLWNMVGALLLLPSLAAFLLKPRNQGSS
jgi:predicted RND superfamily exporter protein